MIFFLEEFNEQINVGSIFSTKTDCTSWTLQHPYSSVVSPLFRLWVREWQEC